MSTRKRAVAENRMPFSWSDYNLSINPLGFLEQQVGAGLYWLDIATNKMSWSEGVYRLFGVLPGEVEPSRAAIRERVHPEDLRTHEEMDRLFSSGHPFHIEHRIMAADRRVRWISNKGEFMTDSLGRPSKVIGVLRDINSIRHSTELVEDYSRRLTAVLKLNNAVNWSATPGGELTSVSNWQSAFLTDEEPLGLKMVTLIHPEDRNDSQNTWRAALARGDKYTAEHRILHTDGSYRWRRCEAVPVRSGDGSVREWIGTTFDIHDQKTGSNLRQTDTAATGAQIRGARSILRLSVRDLSKLTGVSIGTIRRLEEHDGLSPDDRPTSNLLRAEMEKRGVAFIFPPGVKPAVCPV